MMNIDPYEFAEKRIKKIYRALPNELVITRYTEDVLFKKLTLYGQAVHRSAALRFMREFVLRGSKVNVDVFTTERTIDPHLRFVLGHELGHLAQRLYVGNRHNGEILKTFPNADMNDYHVEDMATNEEEVADAFGWVSRFVDKIITTGKLFGTPKDETFGVQLIEQEAMQKAA